MKKMFGRIILLSWSVVLPLLMSPTTVVLATGRPEIPEVDGTYVDPTDSKLKVRVIVHKVHVNKPAKPGGTTPTLVCGLADPDSAAAIPLGGWRLPADVTYRLNPATVPSTVGSANLAQIAANGFADWQTATASQVVFTRGSDTGVSRQANDGQNIIAWGRTSGSALAVTYIRYNTLSGQVVDVDTIFNKSFVWRWSTQTDCAYSGSYDAENILTHELGHWVGLEDVYATENTDNTLYGYGSQQEVKKNTLTTGDSQSAFAAYNP